MATTGYVLAKHFKKHKYTTLESLLPQVFLNNISEMELVKSVLASETRFYVFSHTALSMMQTHLRENSENRMFKTHNMDTAVISRSALYDNKFMIKVRYSRWLGDEEDFICDYITEYYRIDAKTCHVDYIDGESVRD